MQLFDQKYQQENLKFSCFSGRKLHKTHTGLFVSMIAYEVSGLLGGRSFLSDSNRVTEGDLKNVARDRIEGVLGWPAILRKVSILNE